MWFIIYLGCTNIFQLTLSNQSFVSNKDVFLEILQMDMDRFWLFMMIPIYTTIKKFWLSNNNNNIYIYRKKEKTFIQYRHINWPLIDQMLRKYMLQNTECASSVLLKFLLTELY